ncbi:MAG: helix-turn-helix domain-containing protein [Propionibacteriaceae bacterium]|nr:helix-turn-helix domain-containing protein [Propionibacteriaceae bacterium]
MNLAFKRNFRYREAVVPQFAGFAICSWEIQPVALPGESVENVIIPDACIDLVADARSGQVGFAGMKQTDFHFALPAGSSSFGFRLKPGAFHTLTGLPADQAMDGFVPLDSLDKGFDSRAFPGLVADRQRRVLRERLAALAAGRQPSQFMALFDELYASPPGQVGDICAALGYSLKQCQRLFVQHYGLTPKMVLCVLRFQRALAALAVPGARAGDALRVEGYYDQPHLIKDVKQHIGITPSQLIRVCGHDGGFLQ